MTSSIFLRAALRYVVVVAIASAACCPKGSHYSLDPKLACGWLNFCAPDDDRDDEDDAERTETGS